MKDELKKEYEAKRQAAYDAVMDAEDAVKAFREMLAKVAADAHLEAEIAQGRGAGEDEVDALESVAYDAEDEVNTFDSEVTMYFDCEEIERVLGYCKK